MPDFHAYEVVVTAVIGLLTALLGIFKYFNYRTRRDRIALVRDAFRSVIASLASPSEVDRMAAAILLRRFFDPQSEVSIPDTPWIWLRKLAPGKAGAVSATPYWQEAIGVIASVLRTERAGNLQKLLADGLAYAPTLRHADLQRTNLRNVYLGARSSRASGDGSGTAVDLSFADFYRADLSGGSLKNAICEGAVFYQARLHDTVFRGVDLRSANFYEADLSGANFDGALLARADFRGARNVPTGLSDRLDGDGRFVGEGPFKRPGGDAVQPLPVFVSKPGVLTPAQEQVYAAICTRLEAEHLLPQVLDRADYPRFGLLGDIQRLLDGCAGMVVIGFREMAILEGMWRAGTPEERPLQHVHLTTPWSHVEAGMAIAGRLPLLVVAEAGVTGGVFDLAGAEYHVYRLSVTRGAGDSEFDEWCAAVRDRATRG